MLVLIISILGLCSCSEPELAKPEFKFGADTLKIMMTDANDPNPQIHNHKFNGITFKHPKFNSKVEEEYVMKFYKTAIAEHKKYGIPASITLAQGLIESRGGNSKLAVRNNNHFGVKCFSKKCSKGHCTNHFDDNHKDFFRKYNSVWESFRDHSKVLQKERYH